MTNQETLRLYGQTVKAQLLFLGSLIAVVWLVEIIDRLVFQGGLDTLGIIPRNLIGLRGILFAPFLHANFAHLMANTIPFLLLAWLVMVQRRGLFVAVTIVVALVSGLGTWLFGPSQTIHIGASGLVFGYFGFLLLWAYYRRSLATILLAAVLLLLYGSLLWGIIPQNNGISWQTHLFGLIGGGMAAYFYSDSY
jgi:membrane associated rhomboid family serine protease